MEGSIYLVDIYACTNYIHTYIHIYIHYSSMPAASALPIVSATF